MTVEVLRGGQDPGKVPDDRVRQIRSDPKAYFAAARKRARAEILAEREEAHVLVVGQRPVRR